MKKDYTGQHSGRLEFIEPTEKRFRGSVVWKCKCSCGTELEVPAAYFGRKHSCGCYTHEVLSQTAKTGDHRRTHGMKRTRPYYVWSSIKYRCFNANCNGFKNYGGRGITMCDEWKNSFEAFYSYVSSLPHFGEPGYSIDRIDNDGNYEPGNIRYADRRTQYFNSRRFKKNGITNTRLYTSSTDQL